MGTISRSHSFVSGEKPTEDEWNVDIDQAFSLINGNLDKANVDSSSSDGIVTMDEAQTITGRKTFSGNIAAALTIDTVANAAGSVQDVLTLEWDPGDGATLTDNTSGIALKFVMSDDNASRNQDDFAALTCMVVSDASGSEEGEFSFQLAKAGALTEIATLAPTTGLTVGVNDIGYDVTFFGATAGKKVFWDESADTLYQICTVDIDGTVTVGANTDGYDVKFFGNSSGSSLLWDESADDLIFTNAGIAVGSDATGDVYYRNSSGFLARLAVGSDADVLTLASGVPSWATPTSGDITGVTAGNGLSGGGTSGGVTLALDLSELTDTAIAHGDYIVFTDTTDSNATVKGDLADVATLFAGTGLTASNSVIGVDAAQSQITSVGTLTALTVDDIAIDGKVITMTGSSSDTAVFTVGTNGTLQIVTTDAAAAAANIEITADGTVDINSAGVLTLDSGAAIKIEPASGSGVTVGGSATGNAYIAELSGDQSAGSPAFSWVGNTGTGMRRAASDTIAFDTGSTEAIRIDSEQNVGIGQAAPSSYFTGAENLVVGTTTGDNGITIVASTSDSGRLLFADGTSGGAAYAGYIEYEHDNNALIFGAGAAEALRIDSSQNAGLGTTPHATHADWTSLSLGGNAFMQTQTAKGATKALYINQNSHLDTDGSDEYISTDEASSYGQRNGQHVFRGVASGTAGNDITWVEGLTINPDGKVYNTLDNAGLHTGAGNDLRMYHAGGISYVTDTTSHLSLVGAGNVAMQPAAGENGVVATANGAVTLYYDNAAKLATASAGVEISGFVGIGTAPATHQLLVSQSLEGNFAAHLNNTFGAANGFGLKITSGANGGAASGHIGFYQPDGTNDGMISGSGGTITYGAFTGNHPASLPDGVDEYAYGTVMAITGTSSNSNSPKAVIYEVAPTTAADNQAVLGVYSNDADFQLDDKDQHNIFAVGDGHILVCNGNGDIAVGDYISSSAVTGHGQKQADNIMRSITIAKATQAVSWSDESGTTKLISCTYHTG